MVAVVPSESTHRHLVQVPAVFALEALLAGQAVLQRVPGCPLAARLPHVLDALLAPAWNPLCKVSYMLAVVSFII